MDQASDFPLEIDHFGIIVSLEAPELAVLRDIGLQPLGERTEHRGMGTASTAVFFDNAYLELVWVADSFVAGEKWGGAGVEMNRRAPGGAGIPITLVLRRKAGADEQLPFPTRELSAAWMNPAPTIHVAGQHDEPLYLIIPPELAYTGFRDNLPTTSHPIGVHTITGLRLSLPGGAHTDIMRMLEDAGIISFADGSRPLLEITLDGGAQGKTADARPMLPLVLAY